MNDPLKLILPAILSVISHLNILLSHQVPKYLSQQWDKATEKGEVGKITIGK